MKHTTAILLLATMLSGRPGTAAGEPFYPLGVYWPWETTQFVGRAAERLGKLEPFLVERLDDLAAHGVNCVWTVNGPDTLDELALLCRLADARGIRIVAGSGHWALHRGVANETWITGAAGRVAATWAALEGEPRPLAFTLADEPRADYMGAFADFAGRVAAWDIPATTVVMWGDVGAAVRDVGMLRFMCTDVYPFFGSPHGPKGDASYRFFRDVVRRFVHEAQAAGPVPWVMGQAYQEIWGPARQEANGHITVLPGGGTHWLMPTAEQIRWQVSAAAALGAKGIFLFAYSVPFKANPEVDPIDQPWQRNAEFATGGPMSLVSWPGYQPGPQYAAMAEGYRAVSRFAPVLATLRSLDDAEHMVRLWEETAEPGAMVNLLRRAETGDPYLSVVASTARGAPPIELLLNPNVRDLEPLAGSPLPRSHDIRSPPFHGASVQLSPGALALYRVRHVRRYRRDVVFAEDFSTDSFASRALEVHGVRPEGQAGRPRVLRATAGEPNTSSDPGAPGEPFPECRCFIVYDLNAIVERPERPPNATRLFEHRGQGVSPWAGQGVFVWSGPDRGSLSPLVSSAAPRQVVVLPQGHRFLRIGISFRQATAAYAGLESWSIIDWVP